MTADFVAISQNAGASGEPAASQTDAANTPAASAKPEAVAGSVSQPDHGIGSQGEGDLDVDTEALSAMIDARLADADARADPTEVWRLVETGSEAAASAAPLAGEAPTAAVTPSAAPAPATAERDDADVLASLPSLDDWQLVDADAPAAPAPASVREQATESKEADFALSEALAGLELVPMETVSVAQVHTDPIERWLHESEPRKARPESENSRKTAANGGKG